MSSCATNRTRLLPRIRPAFPALVRRPPTGFAAPGGFRLTGRPSGLSLAEMLVATAVFMLVMLTAYQVFEHSNQTYRRGQNQAEMVQSARVAFEQMVNDIRSSGFEFDVDGEITPYPNQPDEPIEYMNRRAIIVRGNFDFDKELKGREIGLENGGQIAVCCPIVTTGNDEIVGFALGKPEGTTQPTGTITAKFDTTGTHDANDTVMRDAYIVKSGGTAGTIVNEETVNVSGFELGALSAPPYVLYRFTFNDDGTVNKQPLIDNVKDLEFTYYNDADTVIVGTAGPYPGAGAVTALTQADWGDDNGQDKAAGRTTRWNVRRVRVTVQTMTPEADMKLQQANNAVGADVANYQGKRVFQLQEDVVPPNLGRHGQTDRDINPPEPVRDVHVCTGECGFVRVDWVPGPPEDKVSDYIVILCNGACLADLSNRVGSFVDIPSYDPTTTPDREYVVHTQEESSLIQNGMTIWARVIPRNQAGTEGECPIADCANCCQTQAADVAVVSDTVRPEAFKSGSGSGYDSADTSWPDAKKDNSGGVLIITDPMDPNYPQANQITLTLKPPQYALNRSGGAGPAPYNWSTKDLPGATAALTCHQEESTPLDASDDPAYRTPINILPHDSQLANTYVFRVSGSDPWNWGGDASNLSVTDPRNFVPGPDNLYDFVYMALDSDTISYVDTNGSEIDEYDDRGTPSPLDDRFRTTTRNKVEPLGGTRPIARPPKSVVPGEVYYYRFRTIDYCWKDKDILDGTGQVSTYADGVEQTDQALGATARKAWATARDYASVNTWHQKAMALTPFYPPLVPAGTTGTDRVRPTQGVHDSDEIPSGNNPISGFAIPGYALPVRAMDGTTYIKPEAPSELYIAKVDETASNLMNVGGAAGPARYDARLVFNSSKRNAPPNDESPPSPVTYTRYRIYHKRAPQLHPTASQMNFAVGAAGPALLEFRTSKQRALLNYTLDTHLKGAPGPEIAASDTGSDEPDNLYPGMLDLGTLVYPTDCPTDHTQDPAPSPATVDNPDPPVCFPWMYRITAVQCLNSVLNDGIDTSSGDESAASRPFLFPCQFYDRVQRVDVTPAIATHPVSVTAALTLQNVSGVGSDATCADLKSARLLAYQASGVQAGDFIGTSDWVGQINTCNITFNQAAVDQALRGFTFDARYVVELSDDASNANQSPTDDHSGGCRVRSDLVGNAGDFGTTMLACANQCGNNGSGKIFQGSATITTTLLPTDSHTMRITIPRDPACTSEFTLFGLEFKLAKVGGGIVPNFQSGHITDGIIGTSRDLPAITNSAAIPDQFEDGNAGEADLDGSDGVVNLRWYQGFCDASGTCGYPKVRSGTSPLVVDLTFAANACDVKLTEFNFRVAIQADADPAAEEMLCTFRSPDPNPPAADGLVNPPGASGTGRGPMLAPADVCASCAENCAPCYCPINETDADIAMDTNPTVSLLTDGVAPNDDLRLAFTQNGCTVACDIDLVGLTIDIQPQVSHACPGDDGFGSCLDPHLPQLKEDGNKLVHGDLSFVTLPAPADIVNSCCSIHVHWTAAELAGAGVRAGETFYIELFFDDDVSDTEISNLRLDFGAPLGFECAANGLPGGTSATQCNKVAGPNIQIP